MTFPIDGGRPSGVCAAPAARGVPGAIDHVLSRKDRRKDIYVDDADRPHFLKALAEPRRKTGIQLH